MSIWHILAGAQRTAPAPALNLERIRDEIENRLGHTVHVSATADTIYASISLEAQVTIGTLTETQIINRLVRGIEREADKL